MEAKFSRRMQDVMSYSREEAVRLGNNYIGMEHFLLGILRDGEGMAVQVLTYLGVNLPELKKSIEKAIRNTSGTAMDMEDIPIVKQAERTLKYVYLEARLFKSETIGTEHLLLAILKDENNLATNKLKNYGITYTAVKDEILSILKEPDDGEIKYTPKAEFPGETEEPSGHRPSSGRSKKSGEPKSSTPVLDNFGRDLTKLAEENRLDPIVGREKELERIAQILSRRKKNNPILIGEPGVGKSAIAEGLALRIVQRKVSRALFNKRIIKGTL